MVIVICYILHVYMIWGQAWLTKGWMKSSILNHERGVHHFGSLALATQAPSPLSSWDRGSQWFALSDCSAVWYCSINGCISSGESVLPGGFSRPATLIMVLNACTYWGGSERGEGRLILQRWYQLINHKQPSQYLYTIWYQWSPGGRNCGFLITCTHSSW